MKFEQDEVDDPRRRPARADHGRPGRRSRSATPSGPSGRQVMSADPVDADVLAGLARNAPLTRPAPGPRRPGRACRSTASTTPGPVLERASARETAARVALGARRAGLPRARRSASRSSATSSRSARRRRPAGVVPGRRTTSRALDADPVRCLDPDASAAMVAEIDEAHKDGDTLGGVVEVVVHGLPPGLGSPRALGPAARRPAGRRADGHPGDQGRRGRRRLRARRDPRARWPTTRSSPTDGRRPAHVSGRSGGTEGGMPPARCCGSGPR